MTEAEHNHDSDKKKNQQEIYENAISVYKRVEML